MKINPVSLTWAVLVFCGFILSVCLHEFGHAVVAYWGGDRSVKDKGYLTLNPLKYTHPTYSIVFPLIFLLLGGLPLPGAAVYINTQALRGRAWRSAVSAAGPLATLLVAIAVAVLLRQLNPDYLILQSNFVADNFTLSQVTPMDWVVQGLVLLVVLEVAGVILNLLPVPGLDGFGMIEPWLPAKLQQQVRKYSRYGVLVLFAAFWVVPQMNQGFWFLVDQGVALLGVPPDLSTLGFYLFRQNAQLIFGVMLIALVLINQWKKRNSSPVEVLSEPSDLLEKKLDQINSDLAFNRTAELLAAKCSVLIQMDRYEEALIPLKQSLSLDPTPPDHWMMKGFISQQLNEPENAIADFQKAVDLDEKNPQYWKAFGGALVDAREFDQALEAYDQAIHFAPDPLYYRQILMLKSHPLFALERYGDCLDALDKVLQTEGDNANALYNQACCYAKLGEIKAGMESLTLALTHSNDELRQQAINDTDLDKLRSHPDFPV